MEREINSFFSLSLDDYPAVGVITWRAGSSNRLEGGVIFTTAEYTLHPDYSRLSLNNDVVVARSNEALQGTNIAPVALAALGTHTPGGTASTTTGWGVTSPGGSLPVILQEVTKPIVGEVECSSFFAITEK
jgi:trypsin